MSRKHEQIINFLFHNHDRIKRLTYDRFITEDPIIRDMRNKIKKKQCPICRRHFKRINNLKNHLLRSSCRYKFFTILDQTVNRIEYYRFVSVVVVE